MTPHLKPPFPFIALCLFTSLLFSACSQSSDRFRLEGHFKNINQGEFYIYNIEQGQKDTIAVNDGRFTYVTSLQDTVTLVMLFPNYSELPIFAQPGADVSIEGDVSHLRETKVSGTDDNKLMTAFRLQTSDFSPPDMPHAAEQIINRYPASPVSCYLLRRYFLQVTTPDYEQALQLCQTLRQAQPHNQQLARLYTLLLGLRNYRTEGNLPDFSAIDTKGDTISNDDLKADANVILTWATWSYDSQNMLRQLATLAKENPRRLSVVSICLDASPSEGKNFLEHDSIPWPCVCDGLLWQSPLLAQLGIATLPSNILTDKQGNITGRNLSAAELQEKINSMLKEE